LAFYPILKGHYCKGKVTLHNYFPNNWEGLIKSNQHMHVTYLKDGVWNSTYLGVLEYGKSRSFQSKDFKFISDDETVILLSLNKNVLSETCKTLPKLNEDNIKNPVWRATLSLVSEFTESSYQGEINPFPERATLLTFCPFIQYGSNIKNYALLLNLETNPKHRVAKIEIYNFKTNTFLKSQLVESNKINTICLDGLGIENNDLPVIICKSMAFIPLYYSCTNDGKFLSLEHTHPPSKFVVHGDRFKVQGFLKKIWLSKLKQ
jgi:hypothetical protein